MTAQGHTEILRAAIWLLQQQKTRNRSRGQDVYDIVGCMCWSGIDRGKIGKYFEQKSSIREIEVRKSNFDDGIRNLAAFDYEVRIKKEGPRDFIPFDDAWRAVISLVESLDIPD